MSAALTLATPEHLSTVATLVTAFQSEEGLTAITPETREAAILPLLEGSPHGAIYLIGPPRAPIGYIVISFGWSLEFGGLDGFVDELYIRPGVRGRGIASEVLISLPAALSKAGLKALHLEVSATNDGARRVYKRAGFEARPDYHLMSRKL